MVVVVELCLGLVAGRSTGLGIPGGRGLDGMPMPIAGAVVLRVPMCMVRMVSQVVAGRAGLVLAIGGRRRPQGLQRQ